MTSEAGTDPKMQKCLRVFSTLAIVPDPLMFLVDPSGGLLGGQFILPSLTKTLPFIHDFVPVGNLAHHSLRPASHPLRCGLAEAGATGLASDIGARGHR